ncbi:DUF159 family protein [Clostridia bacterium]|nr:DUF159 family protein [Clostridia bacterium]
MCGRYYIAEEDISEELHLIIDEVQKNLNHSVPLKTYGEVFPSDIVPIRLRAKPTSREQMAVAAKWGFGFSGSSKLIINARRETVNDKPMFRNAQPCVIPATNYFEWESVADETAQLSFMPQAAPPKTHKVKRSIKPSSIVSEVFYMAGLLRSEPEQQVPVFMIITRPVAPSLAHIHDRMPMILMEEQIEAWLSKGELPEGYEVDEKFDVS